MTTELSGTTVTEGLPRYGSFLMWLLLLAGPIVWAARFTLSFVLVPVVCRTQLVIILQLISVTAIVAIAIAVSVSWRMWRADANGWPSDLESRGGARGFMALGAILLGALFIYVVVLEAIPVFIVDPCL